MDDLICYLKWRGDLTFNQSDCCEVDLAILAQLVLLDFGDIVTDQPISIRDAAAKFFAEKRETIPLGAMVPRDPFGLLRACASCVRFSSVMLHHLINVTHAEEDMQITAFCADLTDDKRAIVYCGTGDTLIAWKENFNLLYNKPTGAQRTAVKYLSAMASPFVGDVFITGHSKGGNLALFASAFCPPKIAKKVKSAVAFDGPGLSAEQSTQLLRSPIYAKVYSVMPRESIIGRLFQHSERLKIAESDDVGLYQHDIFNWHISANHFETVDEFSPDGNKINALVSQIIDEMDEQARELFVKSLRDLVVATKTSTLLELGQNWKNLFPSFSALSPEAKKSLSDVFTKLVRNSAVRRLIIVNMRHKGG